MQDVTAYVEQLGRSARRAAGTLVALDGATKVAALRRIAQGLRENEKAILDANARDVAAAETQRLDAALVHRLRLDSRKIGAMAASVEHIAAQTDPVGQTLEGYVRPNGLRIEKRRVPLGVILFFYESRPNVTSDAAALCLKSGNAVILRGGKEAINSNRAIVDIIRAALREEQGSGEGSGFRVQGSGNAENASSAQSFSSLNPEPRTLNPEPFLADAVQLVESTDRALVPHLLKLDRYIDLVIPRGGESLIRAVVADSTIPVLKHFTGNCHIYIDQHIAGIQQQVRDICLNAKTSYPGGAVCNAVEHLLVHESVAAQVLPGICAEYAASNVQIRADEAARAFCPNAAPATPSDWDTEYLAFIISIKVVSDIDQAIAHINSHGSHHTDAILSTSASAIARFTQRVDSASIMVNASTRFADGGEYGLGAEIGISTDKLHARGPMGAADLTTYKWIVTGDGQIR
jgi:glutamate-5-semialdehyde dehydrogenase